MEINKIDYYRDGGTIILCTDRGDFCIDNRTFTKTKDRLFFGYPEDDDSNIIEIYEDLSRDLIEALTKYGNNEQIIQTLSNSIQDKTIDFNIWVYNSNLKI